MLRDEIEELKGSVENMKKEVKEETLATEMLREIKAHNNYLNRCNTCYDNWLLHLRESV